MPVSCCQTPRRSIRNRLSDLSGNLSPFIWKGFSMNGFASCCQMLLARVRYKKSSNPSFAGKSVIASRAQAATSSIFRPSLIAVKGERYGPAA